MIRGNVQRIGSNLEDLIFTSLSKAHVGEFNIDLESEANVKLKNMLKEMSQRISSKIIEVQVTEDNEALYVTGSFNKGEVGSLARGCCHEFFRFIIGYHSKLANSKTKVFMTDFNFKISQLARKWKNEIPKKTKKKRSVAKKGVSNV
jgi:hypothetical protein